MQSYNFDSDSDEDDIRTDSTTTFTSINDIQLLKERSAELLDSSWKLNKNKVLLTKMLELEEPSITPKMVDFLLQDGVCELLLGFVTQIGFTARPRANDPPTEQLKLAYRATMLLSAEEPSDTLLAFVSKRASAMSRQVFEIFRDDSAGSFYHAYRLLEFLLRNYPAEVYDGIRSDGLLPQRMASLLRYMGHPPVGDMLVMLVTLTPVPRGSSLYITCSKQRWTFFEDMSQWYLLLKIAEVVVQPSSNCIFGVVDEEQHSAAAMQVLQEIVEKLSMEDTGEFLLQILGYLVPGHTRSLLDILMDAATNIRTLPQSISRNAARLLCFLMRRSAEQELVCISGPGPNGAPPQPSYIPNRLHPLRSRMLAMMLAKFRQVTDTLYLLRLDGGLDLGEAVKHPGYIVQKPFSALRGNLVELLVILIESEAALAESISVELWQELISWVLVYSHNNIYHTCFYRLFFSVLRYNQESVIRALFLDARFIERFIENFVPYDIRLDDESELKPNDKSPEYVAKIVVRGVVMNCCNAVRLQAAAMPPEDFLRKYLEETEIWNEFLPKLRAATEFQQNRAMGLNFSSTTGSALFPLPLSAEPKPYNDIDHGSRLAKSLGFIDEVAWPVHSTMNSAGSKRDSEEDKVDGGMKKNKTGASGGSDKQNEDADDMIEEVPGDFSDMTI